MTGVTRYAAAGTVPGGPGLWRRVAWGVATLCALLTPVQSVAVPKAEEYEAAVVRVAVLRGPNRQFAGHGTGFFVSDEGHVVTNDHVVSAPQVTGVDVVYPTSGRKEPATVLWRDADLDLAVLQVASRQAPLVLPLEDPLVSKGTSVYAVGYPGIQDEKAGERVLVAESSFTAGVVSNLLFAEWSSRGKRKLQIVGHTADINPGNSGGPLINDCGHVVGVNTQFNVNPVHLGNQVNVTKGFNYASHISEAIRELQALGVPASIQAAVCEPVRPSETSIMSAVNTGAILLMAGIVGVMIFRQPRKAVVHGAQRTIAKLTPRPASSPPAGGAPAPVEAERLAVRGAGPGKAAAGFALEPLHGGATIHVEGGSLGNARLGISFGRQPALVDRHLPDEGVSRRHFRLSQRDGRVFVEDLNSSNGTSVNGAALAPYAPQEIRPGDQLAAGPSAWRWSRM